MRQRSTRAKNSRISGQFDFEKLEPRYLLAGITPDAINLVAIDVAQVSTMTRQGLAVREHLAETPETAHLQQGSHGLRLVDVQQDLNLTTSFFQQTFDGIPVYDAIVAVVQGPAGEIQQVVNNGYEHLQALEWIGADIGLHQAADAAAAAIDAQTDPVYSAGEQVWYMAGNRIRRAWQINTWSHNVSTNEFRGDVENVIDAYSGQVLSSAKPLGLSIESLETANNIHPRIVINDAIGAAGARAYAAPFDAVVELTLGCTGTLIAPNTVIAARHCGGGPGSTVRFGDSTTTTYTATASSVTFPAGGGSLLDGGDVAIWRLTQDVPANIATPMKLIDETATLVGEVAATLGYGYNGLGSTGHGFSADGWRWGGENIIDRYGSPAGSSGSNIFSTDFDDGSAGNNTISGSDPSPLQFEATTAPGDSGGPLLVQAGGEWVVAGVLSGGTTSTSVYGDISWWTGVGNFAAQIEAAGGVFVGSGRGTVSLDSNNYQVTDTVGINVTDANAQAPIEVTITSDSGDTETITLSPNSSTAFSGSVMTGPGSASANDGTLQVALGDQITVTYIDPDDGNGGSETHTDVATISNQIEFSSVDVPLNISDLQTITSEIVITDTGEVNDLDVRVDITHTYDGDLDVFLIGPNGTRVELFTDVGGSGNNFSGTILDDEASTSITSGSAPFVGSYRPEGNLGVFDGMDITGTWTLEIRDDANLDQGSLNAWSVIIDVIPEPVVNPDIVVISSPSVTENDAAVFEVRLSEASTETVTVNYATTNVGFTSPATPGVDFTSTNGTLMFVPGQVSKLVSVNTLGDGFAEAIEEFGLTISNAVNGTIIGDTGSAQIEDDDLFSLGVAIDFGTESSPIASGSIGFTDLAYGADHGIGWVSSTGLNLVSRNRGSDLTVDLAVMRNGEFAIDLPNGTYDVTAVFGIVNKIDPFEFDLEGNSNTLTLQQGPNVQNVFTVDVFDGQLNLVFDGAGGLDNTVRISGLLVESHTGGRPSPFNIGKNALIDASTYSNIRIDDGSHEIARRPRPVVFTDASQRLATNIVQIEERRLDQNVLFEVPVVKNQASDVWDIELLNDVANELIF